MSFHRPPADRRWRNTGVVRERDSRRTLRAWGLGLALVVALVPAAVYLLQRNHCVATRLEFNALQRELEEARQIERRLAIEWAETSSPERVEAWARKQRDLTRPEARDVIAVTTETEPSEGLVAGSAEPAR